MGIGLIVRAGGTTVGTVILARIANKYLDWNISYAMLFFDLIVAFSSYFIIVAEKLMLTIVILYVGTKVMDLMIEGLNPKKAVTIISEKQNDIAEMVITQMDRGITVLSGHVYYTKNLKEVLYIVISKQEVSTLKKIVKSIDKYVSHHPRRAGCVWRGFLDISK